MPNPSLCICGESGRLKSHHSWFYVECPRGHRSNYCHVEADAVEAWNELNVSGRPSIVRCCYSDLNYWDKMRADGIINIHAMVVDDKRGGYQLQISWL